MIYHFDTATIISLIVSVVIPLVSALLYRAHWSITIIGVLTLALSFANGFLTQWADAGNTFAWQAALATTAVDFVMAVVAHKGVWKATPLEANLIAFPRPPASTPASTPAPAQQAA